MATSARVLVAVAGHISGGSCFPWQPAWSCPVLTRSYLVDNGQAADVVAAVEDAGFDPVGPRRSVPAAGDGPTGLEGERLEGVAWRQSFLGHGLRMEVKVVTDREYVERWSTTTTAHRYVDGETVEVSLFDDRCETLGCGLLGEE